MFERFKGGDQICDAMMQKWQISLAAVTIKVGEFTGSDSATCLETQAHKTVTALLYKSPEILNNTG